MIAPAALAWALAAAPASVAELRVAEIQASLAVAKLDAWLFYDFRGSDPLAYRILGLPTGEFRTRRWYYLVPAKGEPWKLVHAIEPAALAPLPGTTQIYASWTVREKSLADALKRFRVRRAAMQYSPRNAIPYVAKVDAGTVELVRDMGVEVVTSVDLVQRFEAVLTDAQLGTHERAAAAIDRAIDDTFAEATRRLRAQERITERALQEFLVERYRAAGLLTEPPPDVSVDANTADPHYSVAASGGAEVKDRSVLLIDAWSRGSGPDDAYADITKVAYVGAKVPDEVEKVFEVLVRARQAALQRLRERLVRKQAVRGAELDAAARAVVEKAGYGPMFTHRLGHSIGREVHGNGANLDNLETRDDRLLVDRTCFSVEPGIYFTGKWGLRTEIDVCIVDGVARVTTGLPQMRVVPLLADGRDDVADAVEALGPDNDPIARLAAAMELGSYPDPRARTALVAALSDRDANVREQAARSLGRALAGGAADPAAVGALEALVRQEKVETVRKAAEDSLKAIRP